MYSARAKIIKPPGEKPDEFESSVSQVCICFIFCYKVQSLMLIEETQRLTLSLHFFVTFPVTTRIGFDKSF